MNQTGTTLIEFMLATVLSAMLMSMLIKTTLQIKSIHQQQMNLATAQEKGRFLMRFFSRIVSNATDKSTLHILPSGQVPKSWSIRARSKTDVITVHQTRYFIANTRRKDALKKTIFVLYRKQNTKPREELVDGVEGLTAQFNKNRVVLSMQFSIRANTFSTPWSVQIPIRSHA